MFDHLRKLEVPGDAKSWFPVPEIGAQARLLLRPATQQNKQYFNAMLKAVGRSPRLDMRSVEGIEEDRRLDRDLYGKHVLAGWEHILDSDGKDAPFSREAAEEFVQALPAWIFDKVRAHCSAPEKFAGELPDPEQLAKNS